MKVIVDTNIVLVLYLISIAQLAKFCYTQANQLNSIVHAI